MIELKVPSIYCGICQWCIENGDSFEKQQIEYYNHIKKRKEKRYFKPNTKHCNHPDMVDSSGKPKRLNKNHLRWWLITPDCPINPYTHQCEGCGKRMASEKTVCASCELARLENGYYGAVIHRKKSNKKGV